MFFLNDLHTVALPEKFENEMLMTAAARSKEWDTGLRHAVNITGHATD